MGTPLALRVEPQSPVPIYRQLVEQIRMAVAGGRVRAGDRLPGVRELAEDLAINLQTVQKAYGELVRAGTLTQQRGLGTFIAPVAAGDRLAIARSALEARLRQIVRDAHTAGLGRAELTRFVAELWSEET